MFDAADLGDDIDAILADYAARIADAVLGANVPFLAEQLADEAATLLADLQALRDQIAATLATAGTIASEADLQDLADLLNATTVLGDPDALTASVVDGDLVLMLEREGTVSLPPATLDTAGSLGLGLGAIDVDASVEIDAAPRFAVALIVDGGTGAVALDGDAVDGEFQLAIDGELAFAAAAMGALGFLDVAVEDADGDAPGDLKDDLDLDLALDLTGGGLGPGAPALGAEATLSGRATLEAQVLTSVPTVPVLPQLSAELFAEFTYADAVLSDTDAAQAALTLELRDVQLKLEALAEVLREVFSTVGDVVRTFPIGEIVDLLTARLPVVDDLAPDSFDLNKDGKISLRDVVAVVAKIKGESPVFDFIDAVIGLAEVIQAVEALADGLAEDASLDVGTLRVADGVIGKILDGDPLTEADEIVAETSDLVALGKLVEALGDFAEVVGLAAPEEPATDGTPAPAPALTAKDDAFQVEFPFLQSPEALAESLAAILLNGLDAPPVTLVEADFPELAFEVREEIPIRLPPFVGYVGGRFFAGVDFSVGYDTAGFSDGFDFTEGLFISPDLPAVTVGTGADAETKQPVGRVELGVFAGGGLDVVIARAAVEGGLLGTLDVFLGGTGPGDDKARLSELGGCLFDDIAGRLTAGLDVVFKIGFGFFSVTKRVGLAEVTLAQFDIDPCNPPVTEVAGQIEVDMSGLAFQGDAGLLTLNLGERADLRALPEDADSELDADGVPTGTPAATETFTVTPVPADKDDPAGAGEVAVEAFGVFERYGEEEAVKLIEADGGSEDDTLTVSAALGIAARLSGGKGSDRLQGGGGDDILSGGAGDDQLSGGAGADALTGGEGDDILSGGAGADAIDGGEGEFDQVDYSGSAEAVRLAPTAADPAVVEGSGGEAEGDTLTGVEHFVGSRFADTIFGSATASNILEGNAGADLLVGGSAPDLFLGGAGGDVMRGNRPGEAGTGGDAASYVFSPGAVLVHLPANFAAGGDATGDSFEGIEDFQLTAFGDRITGSDAANLIDAYDGDDRVRGGGGADTVNAGLGDDVVEGGLDGDALDGGGFANFRPGRDWLSYADAAGAVTVDLIAGEADGAGGLDTIARASVLVVDAQGNRVVAAPDPAAAPRLSSFENLRGSAFGDALTGDDGRNEIEGGLGDDAIDGGAGDDTLRGGAGADALTGGAGLDTADYDASPDGVTANLTTGAGVGGDAQGDSFATVENLIGSRARDTLVGDGADNRLDPNGNAAGGTEILLGAGGTDTAVLDFAGTLTSDGYQMVLDAAGSGSFLRPGGPGGTPLVQMTSIEDLEVFTSEGDDLLFSASGGDDLVNGGGGDDVLSFGAGLDVVLAGAGDDTVLRLAAASFEDFGPGDPDPGAGEALAQSFLLDGGAGVDRLFVDLSFETGDLRLFNGPPGGESDAVICTSTGGTIRNFEVLAGVVTGAGDDDLGQLGAVDSLFATGAGADTVTTGFGFDRADGGTSFTFDPDGITPGDDALGRFVADVDVLVVDYASAAEGAMLSRVFREDGGQQQGVVELSVPTDDVEVSDVLARVEHADFERALLTGTARADRIIGLDGGGDGPGDVIDAGAGDDVVLGGGGDDLLIGGDGDDVLLGDAGDDTLVGATRGGPEEQDVLVGGAGADLFVLGDEEGLIYDGVEDGAQIGDFSARAGDRIALLGVPGDYLIESVVTSPAVLNTIFLRGEDGEAGRRLAEVAADRVLDLEGPEFVYDVEAGLVPESAAPPPVLPGPDLPPPDLPAPELPGFELPDLPVPALPGPLLAGPALPGPFVSDAGASPDPIATLAALDAPATTEIDLALPLWRAGALGDAELMEAVALAGAAVPLDVAPLAAGALGSAELMEVMTLAAAEGADAALGALPPAAPPPADPIAELPDPGLSVAAADVLPLARSIIADAVGGFAVSLGFADSPVAGIAYEGDAAAAGAFTDAFGHERGVVLSTGRVAEIAGPNLSDGRTVLGPRPSLDVALEFEEVGALASGTLYRAALPDVAGGIASLQITDDADFAGGAAGRFSAFDLDALALSRTRIETTAGLSQADFNAIDRLDVLDLSLDSIVFEPGAQRPGAFQAPDLFGTVNGFVDLASATLDRADGTGGVSADEAGGVSLGEGGSLGLNLVAPVTSEPDDPTYLYVVEGGGKENLQGVVQASASPIGTEGDLSTDLGRPGLEDDAATLTASFFVDFDAPDGPRPDFDEFTFVDLFEVVVVSEELPERGGALLPDLVSVKVNGVDAITDPDGATVTLDALAPSPYGPYAPGLTLNPAGEGPLADTLRADAYTKSYRVSGPILNGFNTIEISVADRADALLDTAIFVAPLSRDTGGNRPPTGGSRLEFETPENAVGAFDVSATDPDGDAVDYALRPGGDADLFAIDAATGVLAFREPSDFEAPRDAGGDNAYDVTVVVSDGTASVEREVRVTVTDVEEGDRTRILGTPGSDRLAGTAADEALVPLGGPYDVLRGGGGADDFVFGPELGNGRRERDVILDYDAAEGDRIVLPLGAEVVETSELADGLALTLGGDRDLVYVRGEGLDPGSLIIVNEEFVL